MTLLVVIICTTMLVAFASSLFEAVLFSLPLPVVEDLNQKGSATGRLFKAFKHSIQKPIAAILGLNMIANTAGAALIGAVFVETYGDNWLMPFTIGLTLLMLFFSEIVPKTLGAHYSRSLARFTAWPIQLLIWVLAPLVMVIQKMTEFMLPKAKSPYATPAELLAMTSLVRKEGAIEFMDEKIIENVLRLRFKKAADIMTPRTVVLMLDADLTIDEVRKEHRDLPHSRVPIYKNDPENIVGFIMRRDTMNMLADGKGDVRLSEMVRPIHFVPGSIKIDRLLKTFLDRRQHLFAVVDEYGGLAGVISLEDVLEELIGREIIGEMDPAIDMSDLARKKRRLKLGYSKL